MASRQAPGWRSVAQSTESVRANAARVLDGWRRYRRRLVLSALAGLVLVLAVDFARLDLTGPVPTWLLLDRHGRFIAEIGQTGEDYGYWPLEKLPTRVVAATLALEDRHFRLHPGVDPLAAVRAVYQNLSSGERVSGASTISMQVARLLDPGTRTWWHKLRETWRGLAMTVRFGRDDVLAAYLRLVPYGNRVHGIAYAARRYLDKPVADLSWAEIAFLSAIPQAPTLMNPFRENGRQRAIARGQRILERLREKHVLTEAEYALASQQIVNLSLPWPEPRPQHALHTMFKLRDVLNSVPRSGSEPYRVVTSLDLDIQSAIARQADAAVSEWAGRGAGNAAAILVERKTNQVLAWLGSTDYFAGDRAGAIDYARTPRSPGSALKPFIYALAYERGQITPATILDDLPAVGNGIVNADRRYLGPLLPRQALANSRNVPAAQLLDNLGVDEGYTFLQALGLHDREHDARHYGLGLVIGAMPVTLESLVGAYTVLANDGEQQPLCWRRDETASGRRLLSPATARLLTLHLADTSARLPTFPRMGSTEFAYPVALKTGTSQGMRDAWAVAWSRRYLLGVWVGHPDARPMHELTGASSAAELAQRILNELHGEERHGLADLGFPPPEGYRPVSICAHSGKLATPACEQVFEEWFAPGEEPREQDDSYVRLAIDVRNGLVAHAGTPARYVERRTFVSLPPRYAEWAAESGLPRLPEAVSLLPAGAGSVRRAPADVGLASAGPTGLRIVMPRDGLRLLRDPTIPAVYNTIGLRAEVSPAVKELLWLVDGKPFRLAAYPYAVRWPLQSGEHLIQAQVPLTREFSVPIRVRVD